MAFDSPHSIHDSLAPNAPSYAAEKFYRDLYLRREASRLSLRDLSYQYQMLYFVEIT
jgi:hypothetical protein